MLRSYFVIAGWIVCSTIGAISIGYGQTYPTRPIRFVVSGAGSSADLTSREIAQGISGPLNQPVVVDNRLALLSAEIVSKAAPDGYTLLATGNSIWVSPLLQKVPYDIVRDFSPVTIMNRSVLVVAVNPSVPANSIQELIALAKAKPGELNYSHSGTGGPAHLGAELFKSMAGVNIVSVPYKGGAPALTALVSGEVQLLINAASQVMPQAKAGKVRGLAVTSLTPSVLAPGLPTVAGSGLPGYEAIGMTATFVPIKTPKAIVNRLNQEIVRFLNSNDVKERFFNAGLETVANSPEEAMATIKADIARVSKLIKEANIKTQ